MRRDLEALLFATDVPLTLGRLAAFFPDVDKKGLRAALQELQDEYDRNENAFTIVEFGGGYSISTRPEYGKVVRKLFRGRRVQRLSKAALECLAIVAYKQPATRLEIEEIRGVSVSGVIGTLMERDLIAIVGRAQGLGQPLLYGTTRGFLDYLGLKSLAELPKLSELEELLSQKEELKQLAARYGEEVSDEELDSVIPSSDDEPESDSESEDTDAELSEDADAVTDAAETLEDGADEELEAGDTPEDDGIEPQENGHDAPETLEDLADVLDENPSIASAEAAAGEGGDADRPVDGAH